MTARVSSFANQALPALALLLLPLTACSGAPDVSDDTQGVVVTFTGTASDPSVASTGMPAGGLAIARAYLSTTSVSLMPCDAGAANIELEPRGYDLLDDPAPSEAVTSAVRQWCAIQVDVGAGSATKGVPKGSSLYIEGQDADGNPITAASTASTSVMLQVTGDTTFGTDPVLVGVDLSRWLNGLPTGADMTDQAASALIDALPSAMALYVDTNHNDALDDDEKKSIAVGAVVR